jgi:hypothetical protein
LVRPGDVGCTRTWSLPSLDSLFHALMGENGACNENFDNTLDAVYDCHIPLMTTHKGLTRPAFGYSIGRSAPSLKT